MPGNTFITHVGAQFIAPETSRDHRTGAMNRAPASTEILDPTSNEIPNVVGAADVNVRRFIQKTPNFVDASTHTMGAQFIAPETSRDHRTGAMNRAPTSTETLDPTLTEIPNVVGAAGVNVRRFIQNIPNFVDASTHAVGAQFIAPETSRNRQTGAPTSIHLPARRSHRLPNFNYAQGGAYFITICTKDRACLFGNIANDVVVLSDLGQLAASCWQEIPLHFPSVILDEFIVMPNHVHGIVFLTGNNAGAQFIAPETPRDHRTGAMNRTPTSTEILDPTLTEIPDVVGAQYIAPETPRDHRTDAINCAPKLGEIVRAYKARVSRAAGFSRWQRNYHEHVIRDESSLQHIREYVVNNPAQWAMDSENPDRPIFR